MSEEDAVIDAVEILELIENLSQIGNESIKLQRFINQFVSALNGVMAILWQQNRQFTFYFFISRDFIIILMCR